VLATNPIFPEAAIRERMRWAGVDGHAFAYVTTYETSTACKPHLQYFREIAQTLDVDPQRCLFVGDDASLDLPARHTGMNTFYVGHGDGTAANWTGDLESVAGLLRTGDVP
jgi:FMN phosphatase YigB (HAD superfamily)